MVLPVFSPNHSLMLRYSQQAPHKTVPKDQIQWFERVSQREYWFFPVRGKPYVFCKSFVKEP